MNIQQKKEPVDLAKLFDEENKQNSHTWPSDLRVKPLSASNRPKSYRDEKGRVDMAALLNDEAKASGLVTLSVGDDAYERGINPHDNSGDLKVTPDKAPSEILIAVWGPQPAPLSYLLVDKTTMEKLQDMQSAMNITRVPIYDHGLPLVGDDKQKVDDTILAGDGLVTVRDGDGLYLTNVNWTDDGLKCLTRQVAFRPTVWLENNLAEDGTASIIGVKCLAFGNSFEMLPAPAFVNLSAVARCAQHERMVRALNAENAGVRTFKNFGDKPSLVKLLSAGSRIARNPDGSAMTTADLEKLSIQQLQILVVNIPEGRAGAPSGLTLLSATSGAPAAPSLAYMPPGDLEARDREEKRLKWEREKAPWNAHQKNPYA